MQTFRLTGGEASFAGTGVHATIPLATVNAQPPVVGRAAGDSLDHAAPVEAPGGQRKHCGPGASGAGTARGNADSGCLELESIEQGLGEMGTDCSVHGWAIVGV